MAELTIQIPDELATRLEPLRECLPELLAQLLETVSRGVSEGSPERADSSAKMPPVYAEVLDFLLKRPTPQEIAAFKVSPQAQERLRALLEKNREAALTDEETAELDVYEQLEHLMILLKARAINSIS
jgi:hypothetical protein